MVVVVKKSEARRGMAVTWIAIHTNEGPNPADVYPDRTAENLAAYLDRENTAGRHKSYHHIVDDDSEVEYVPDDEAAWALPYGGNLPGLQLCFTGWAAWDRAEWLRHDRMLRIGAARVLAWSRKFGIPLHRLTPAHVALGQRGVIGHVDWTRSGQHFTPTRNRGTHTDPGPGFPWDVFLGYITTDNPSKNAPESDMAYRLDPTPIPTGATPEALPDGSWWAVEDTIATPGPAGGWRGRILAHPVFGWGGGFIQEAWSGPSGKHYVERYDHDKRTGGRFVPAFVSQSWELPAGDKFLVIRYATRNRGSVGIEPQR